MKTLLALLLIASPAVAGGFAIDDPMTMQWADAKERIVITTWDDQINVTEGDDLCYQSIGDIVDCESGATAKMVGLDETHIIWNGIKLHLVSH